MKLYRIKQGDLYWDTKKSLLPVWTEEGNYFTEAELKEHLRNFKYQRSLWPKGAKVEEYILDETSVTDSTLATDIFTKFDEELTFEKLKGSAY